MLLFAGMEVLKKLGSVQPDPYNGVPLQLTKITDAGLFKLDKEYELAEKDLDREDDIGAKGLYVKPEKFRKDQRRDSAQKSEKETTKEKDSQNKKSDKKM